MPKVVELSRNPDHNEVVSYLKHIGATCHRDARHVVIWILPNGARFGLIRASNFSSRQGARNQVAKLRRLLNLDGSEHNKTNKTKELDVN